MQLKNTFKNSTAALAFGLIGLAATPAALAADYDSNLLVQINNLRISAGTLGGDVTATFGSTVLSESADAFGPAWAAYDKAFYTVDGLEHDQNVTGSAYNWGGVASSQMLTDGYIKLGNTSGAAVTFTFDYAITGSAKVSGQGWASAYGSAEIFDTTHAVSVYRDMQVALDDVTFASISETGSFSVTLDSGATSDISVLVTNSGTAVVAVPEPETYAMMLAGLGLLGFVVHRRKA
jgi:hypothetical protein